MAVVCWFTNWLGVKLLFKPTEAKGFGFLRWQGILPKRQDVLAEKIGVMFAEELFLSGDLKRRIKHPDNINRFTEFVEEKIDYYLRIDFPARYPFASMFFGQQRRDKIKYDLLEQVQIQAPIIVDQVLEQLDEHIKMEDLVTDRVTVLSTDKLEQILNTTLRKDMIIVGFVAAFCGFFIGCIQTTLILVLR